MAEMCMKEACGSEVPGEAVPGEAVPGQAAPSEAMPSEAGSGDTNMAVCSEACSEALHSYLPLDVKGHAQRCGLTCSEGVEQGSGEKSEKVEGDTDSAASGANTHVIM